MGLVQAAELTLTAARIEAPGVVVRDASARIDARGTASLDLRFGSVEALGRIWHRPRLVCDTLQNGGGRIGCLRGALEADEKIPVRFGYEIASGALDAEILPARDERWRAAGHPFRGGWKGRVEIEQGSLLRLAPLLPATWPRLTGGRVSADVDVIVSDADRASADGEARFAGVSFSDASGLHAGEKLAGVVKLSVADAAGRLAYRIAVDWNEGGIFWQPLYLKGGQSLSAQGSVSASRIVIDSGTARLGRAGQVAFTGVWDRGSQTLVSSAGGGAGLAIPGLYEELAKPFLEHTAAADLRTAGTADFGWRFDGGALQAWYLNLHGAFFEDRNRRFGVFGLNAAIPWDRVNPTQARVSLAGAELLRVPIGTVELPIDLDGFSARVASLDVPVFEGGLQMRDFTARRTGDAWEWEFSGGITPVSVEALTRALGTHVMHGTLSAVIPKVRYRASTLTIDGALLFRIFDGTVVVKALSLFDPVGRAPRLYADLDMRNLDLDLLTRAFSFGSITGRVDAAVRDLELSNWRPVKFDARIESSPGSYPRRISQRAVENIAALGGGSATAAIQRTALRFFEQFGYSKIGWSCRLRDGVCEMGGIAPTKDGAYVIVEGGGVPAITVMGYNRAVDWEELIARLARVTREGVTPTIE